MSNSRFISPERPVNSDVCRCSIPFDETTQRILIVRLGAYGDVLMGTPLAKALRKAYPEAWITWAVEKSAVQSVDANPYIDEILEWRSGRMLGRGVLNKLLLPLRRRWLKGSLDRHNFTTFISFQAEELTFLTKMLDARVKIGFFQYFEIKNIPASELLESRKLFTHCIEKPEHPVHRTDQYLSALKALDVSGPFDRQMDLGITQNDKDTVTAFLSERGIDSGQPYIVVAPITTWVTRNWPLDRYVAVADKIYAIFGYRAVVIGSAREAETVNKVVSSLKSAAVEAAGRLTFRQMGALISGAKLLLSGDSGPMHVAGAVKAPFVAVFGSTPIDKYLPMERRGLAISHPVPCGPCDWLTCKNRDHPMLCLDLVTVETVFNACENVLLNSLEESQSSVSAR